MALKYQIETTDGLSPEIAALYEKTDNGFRLDVEGAAPREKLDEFRNNNIELLKKLENFKGVDIKRYAELQTLESRVKSQELIEAGKLDEIIQSRTQSMKQEFETTTREKDEKLQAANSQLENLLIDSAVRVKAIEHGVLPTAVEDVMLRAKGSFKIIDGVAVPHADGKPVYGKDGVHPMSVEEWISTLSKGAPHLFQKSTGGGAPGSGRAAGGGAKLSSIQKIAQGLGA